MNRLSDEDVDRIASRVVGKFVLYVLVLVAAIWVLPIAAIGVLSLISATTREVPWVALPLATIALAGPVVLLIWIWGTVPPLALISPAPVARFAVASSLIAKARQAFHRTAGTSS